MQIVVQIPKCRDDQTSDITAEQRYPDTGWRWLPRLRTVKWNKMFVVKYKWKGLLGRPSRRWEDDIKMVIKDKECEGSCGLG
jgi:hypothetical protein